MVGSKGFQLGRIFLLYTHKFRRVARPGAALKRRVALESLLGHRVYRTDARRSITFVSAWISGDKAMIFYRNPVAGRQTRYKYSVENPAEFSTSFPQAIGSGNRNRERISRLFPHFPQSLLLPI